LNPDLLSASQLAEYLGVSINVVHNLTRKRTRDESANPIAYLKVGRSLKFRKSSVDAWIAAKEVK
jgi:excisionase family DNA binding protein